MFKIPFTNFVVIKEPRPKVDKEPLSAVPYGASRPTKDVGAFRLSVDLFFKAYRVQADIYACIREWKQNVGAGGFKLLNAQDPDEPVSDSLQKEIWEVLNFQQSFEELYQDTLYHLGVAGNAYWAFIKSASGDKVLGLETLDPRTVAKLTDKNGVIHAYIQKVNTDVVAFEPHEVIEFKLGKDPRNEIFGLSPMETVIWEARTDLNAMITNYSFFENDAVPAAQYIFDEGMSKEELEKAIAILKKELQGADNKHKPIAMAGIKEIKTIGMNHRDMEFIAGRKFSTEKIAEAYGVPKFMLGFTETVNNNNGVELTKNAYAGTFKPLEKLLDSVINRDFFGRLGLSDQVRFSTNEQIINLASVEKRGLEEYKNGALTLRQYKIKTNKPITDDDEANPMIDQYVIHSGGSAKLLEDVLVDSEESPEEGTKAAENFINALENVGT